MHIIMSYHPWPLCIHDSHFLHVHEIGATEEITMLEYEADPQEMQGQESPVENSCPSVQIISPEPLWKASP